VGAGTATPRPTYEQRREQQIAEGALPVPQKPEKKYSLRVQWSECRGESFKDTENGAVPFRGRASEKPTKFLSYDAALEAEEEHFKECGCHEQIAVCPSCSLRASSMLHKRQVWHVAHRYSGQ
jgi:hypothetical protein